MREEKTESENVRGSPCERTKKAPPDLEAAWRRPRPVSPLQRGAPDFPETVARLPGLPLDAFAESGHVLAPASALPRGAPGFPEALVRVLKLPLRDLDRVVRVRVPWWSAPLWFVPTEEDAEALVAAGEATRGAVWTAGELLDLLAVPGLTRAGARTVALAKLAVAGEVAEVRAASPSRCRACKGQRWWRSTAGRTVCATCHPPEAGAILPEAPK